MSPNVMWACRQAQSFLGYISLSRASGKSIIELSEHSFQRRCKKERNPRGEKGAKPRDEAEMVEKIKVYNHSRPLALVEVLYIFDAHKHF